MALFGIGDLHLSLGGEKPMDVFRGWENHTRRLEENWRSRVGPKDTVVLLGDTSWAMRLEDTLADFAFLQGLPGRKILLKGNHDYWWSTVTKMTGWLDKNRLDTLSFLHNNSFSVDGYAVCGTRSWLFDPGETHDMKVMHRESGRLRASLGAADPAAQKLVFLHYPPVYANARSQEIIDVMNEYRVEHCFYGHLHGQSIPWAVQGGIDVICYRLLSANSRAFEPEKIEVNA